jgi:hypothetical protein
VLTGPLAILSAWFFTLVEDFDVVVCCGGEDFGAVLEKWPYIRSVGFHVSVLTFAPQETPAALCINLKSSF